VAVLAVLASAATLVRLGYLLLRGRRDQAARTGTRLAIAAGTYLVVSLSVSALRPERSIGLGERWCFDDWCVSVDQVTRRAAARDAIYTLDLQTYNEAKRPEAARYPWMFVRDEDGRQYLPQNDEWVGQVESRIPPHQSNRFSVEFRLPADTRLLSFVTGHGSGSSCTVVPAVLVVGEGGCLFHKYDSIRLE
jgi:hypothetical protein